MNNKIYHGLAIVLFSGLAQISTAENYSSELTANYQSADVDGQSDDMGMYGVVQKVYFSDVDTSVGPLAKAAFVSRASSYTIGYSENENIDAHTTHAAIDWLNKDTGLILSAAYSSDSIDTNGIDTDGAGSDQLELSVGKYVGETTTVSLQYSRAEDKQNSDLVEDAYSLSISHVGITDVSFAVEGSISMADTLTDDEQFGLALSATLYPSSKLGIGAGFDIALADIDDDRVFAFAEWFFKPNVRGSATYYISDQDNIDVTGLSLELSLRL
jgi:hypothetical protein